MMESNNEANEKLARLKKNYHDNLSNKIAENATLLQRLLENWNADDVVLLHRKMHSLHGSATIYGYPEIGQFAATVEVFLKDLLNIVNPSIDQKNHLTDLMNSLQNLVMKAVSDKTSFEVADDNHQKSSLNKIVYFLEADKAWANQVIVQVEVFGYQVRYFDNSSSFIEAIEQSYPVALLIDMNLLNEELESRLHEIQENIHYKNTAVFFIATHGEFSLRLKAVQLGGQAFFIKNFLIEDLIAKLDRSFESNSENCRILIVDDEQDVADYHSAILTLANMTTRIITDARDIDLAMNEFKPNLILMDLYMPGCSGMQLANIIRQQSTYESIPIMFLSSEEDRLIQLTAMKLGADDFVAKSSRPDYLVMAIRNRVNRYHTLRSMMVRDNLTGLYNHSFIHQQLDSQLNLATRTNTCLCVVMIDLDDFKKINDMHGHQVGDQVLRSLSLMMRTRLRSSDIVGRYGGEEFLIILPNTLLKSASFLIDELRVQFSKLVFSLSTASFQTTFSAGIAGYPEYDTTSELIQAADKKLYQSKNTGKNRVSF